MSLETWEIIEYLSAGIVLLGVIGEYVADFTEYGRKDCERQHGISKRSTLILIGGLSVELICLVKTNRLAGELIAAVNLEAKKTDERTMAMLKEQQPRDFTKPQMDAFVAAIKGKVATLNVFTLASDTEAARYGNEIMDGLQKAGVNVSWYRVLAPYFDVPGVALTGITLYEHPDRAIGGSLFDAFVKVGQLTGMAVMAPKQPPNNVPVPALFIALKQPAFIDFPGYLKSPQLEALRPPWEPKK